MTNFDEWTQHDHEWEPFVTTNGMDGKRCVCGAFEVWWDHGGLVTIDVDGNEY